MTDDDAKKSILARRSRFIAKALASAGIAACAVQGCSGESTSDGRGDAQSKDASGEDGEPQVCLTPQYDGGDEPQVCLSIQPDAGEEDADTGPQPCLEPPIDASDDAEPQPFLSPPPDEDAG
jgi:hypothetical protein